MIGAEPRPPVVELLRREIVTCAVRPGSRLVQQDLAARFGVSRIPLREALRVLEGEGLVVMAHNRGAIVPPLEPGHVRDLYDVRIALERLACRGAAERAADVRAKTARLRRRAKRAMDACDLEALLELDRSFHGAIAEASGNAALRAALATSWSHVLRAVHYYLSIEAYPAAIWSEHDALARTIGAADVAGAAAAVEAHLVRSRDTILDHLGRTGA